MNGEASLSLSPSPESFPYTPIQASLIPCVCCCCCRECIYILSALSVARVLTVSAESSVAFCEAALISPLLSLYPSPPSLPSNPLQSPPVLSPLLLLYALIIRAKEWRKSWKKKQYWLSIITWINIIPLYMSSVQFFLIIILFLFIFCSWCSRHFFLYD